MKAGLSAAILGMAAALFAGLTMLGCPGTLTNKECFLQERDAHSILLASCTGTTCHNAEDMTLGLDLETSGIGSRLSGKVALTCNGATLVEPGKPDQSVLYTKLLEAPPCGSRMPLGQPELYPEDIEVIRVWIAGMDGSCAGQGTGGTGGGTTSSGGAGGTGGSGGAATGGTGGAGGTGGM